VTPTMTTVVGSVGFSYLANQLPRFWDALLLTLALSGVSMLGAVVWGLILVGPRMSHRRIVSAPVIAYIEFVRNTPLLLQIYVVYFGLPLLGVPLSAFLCGVTAIASQHGAFLAEIYRAGIEAVSRRQWEAALALGMTPRRAKHKVVLPQALRKVIPPIGNQLVMLIKDTSLVSAIGILELTLTGKLVVERTGASFHVFLLIGGLYLIVTTIFGGLLRAVEMAQRARQ
jgi:His/Glu/Gln/Arg/opine family amino acid ABC transporter permease subunit